MIYIIEKRILSNPKAENNPTDEKIFNISWVISICWNYVYIDRE